MYITVAVILAALVGGLLTNRFIRPRTRGVETDEGHSINDLMNPFQTLAVLLLAFVLVMAAQSYDEAGKAAKAEADAVDYLYEVASFAPPEKQQRLQSSVICYVRAVRTLEWPIMTQGGISAVADGWTDDFTRIFATMSEEPYFDLLVKADHQRSQARNTRLAQAKPAIPGYMFWFMAVVLGLCIIGLAFAVPRRNNIVQVATLCVLSLLFAGSLVLIRDIDRPFTGLVSVGQDALAITQEHIVGLYSDTYGMHTLPCDESGRPTG